MCILPFTGRIAVSDFDNTVLLNWLSLNYPNITDSYKNAIKAYSNGDESGCIMHCRNIIKEIFTYKKIKIQDGNIDPEEVYLEYALMALKGTEAVLIWVYQSKIFE